MEQTHNKYNRIIAWGVLLFTFATYLTTVAPTVAFWDCGEYIGASHSLGVPHPPGNPLYVLIGRVFSMTFFFFKQVAYRINLISILSASFASMLIYLIIVRAMVSWMGIPDTTWKRITVYIAGVVGALYVAFGYTFWFSSVEASVYIPSMLVVVLCTWLSLVWYQSKSPDRDRILILIAYIAFIGISIHMMAMFALIPIGLFVMITDENKGKDWRFWVVTFAMLAVVYHVSLFLWLGPLTVVATFMMSFIEKSAIKKWRLYFWIAFFALLGYTVHAYIPIRSTIQPTIDENHPVVEFDESGTPRIGAFKQFLERKQYGSESMVTRAFWPLAKRTTQFGVDGHMGWGGFHLTQFFHFGKSIGIDRNNTVFENWGSAGGLIRLFLYLIPTFIMIYGWLYLWKRNRNVAILLIFLFVLTSVILVFYMNFADGTRPMKRDYMAWVRSGRQGQMPLQHREVRIRDYFFSAGFMFYGMWVGLAFGCILHALFTSANRFLRTQLAPIAAVLFAVSPALPFTQNYKENDRTKDWVPFDYAYNLLMSCERDGIIFTNGDNDTFPLWFLQEAAGVRRDVRIVNLSLLNTKWYIKQIKTLEPKVAISYTIKEIEDKLNHQYNPLEKAVNYRMPNAGIVITLPGRDTKHALRVQDQMVVNIVDSNKWKKPIYFAVTVSGDNLMGVGPYLQMQGLVYRVLPRQVPRAVQLDLDRTIFLLDKVYRFRSLGDGSAPISETGRKLMSNYAASFIQVAVTLRQPLAQMKAEIAGYEASLNDSSVVVDTVYTIEERMRDIEAKRKEYNEVLNLVVNKLDQCIGLMPWDWRPRLLQQEILLANDRWDEAMERIEVALKIEPGNKEYRKVKARIYDLKGDKAKANELLKGLAGEESDPWPSYSMICKNYEDRGHFDSAVMVMQQFQMIHPGDRRAAAMISRLEKMKADKENKKEDTSGVLKIDSAKLIESKG
ncbi:protein O-mannosyl-transferase family [Fibrobacterota bacterium]